MKHLLILLLIVVLGACQSNEKNDGESDNMKGDTMAMEEHGSENEKPLLSPPDSSSITVGDLSVKVTFGSPSVRDREIWGALVPYDKIWRIGANEATTLAVSRDVNIKDDKLLAGRYGLFAIPSEDEWIVILNKVWDQWGAYEYNDKEDILRFSVKPKMVPAFSEHMDFDLEETDGAVKVVFQWEKLMFSFLVGPA